MVHPIHCVARVRSHRKGVGLIPSVRRTLSWEAVIFNELNVTYVCSGFDRQSSIVRPSCMVSKMVPPKNEIANLAPNYQDGTRSIYIGGLKRNYCFSRPMLKITTLYEKLG